MPDYREQYVNNDHKSHTLNQSKLSNEKHQLLQECSFTSMPASEFEMNSMNETKTSFFSPSTFNLPNEDNQYTGNHSSNNTNALNNGSILIHNYSVQENQKLSQTPQT